MKEKIRSVGGESETVEALKDTVTKARTAVAGSVGVAKEKLAQVGGEFGSQAGRAGSYAKQRADHARENLVLGYDRARKDVDQLGSDIGVFVRDNPGRSVLIAAGCGFLLGYVLRGDRR